MAFTKLQNALIDPMWDMIEATDSFTWQDVMKVVENEPVTVKNWMPVRDVMASICHELGYTRDVSDLRVERYIKQ